MAYFSNGTEGEVLDLQCARCSIGGKQCPVALVQSLYNYQQHEHSKLRDAMNLLIDEAGVCQVLPLIESTCK